MNNQLIIYRVKIVLTFALLALNLGCGTTINSATEIIHWVNDQDNGLLKTKNINGFKLSAKYLPPEYLAYKEAKDNVENISTYDSLLNHYSRFRTFLLTIAPDEEINNSDVMFYNILNEQDYRKRVNDLNFDIKSFISITTLGGETYPQLHTFENTYELAKHKSIYLVFTDDNKINDLMTSDKIDLKFEDRLFDTGTSHFVFNKKDLDKLSNMKVELFEKEENRKHETK